MEEDGVIYDAVVVGSGYGGSVAACRMSMAGIKVCLIEKGRRWEAQDFPTDSLSIMSASRIENRNLGVSFGPKNSLFQVYEQGDSIAAVACGLGGGSLVNAGVMIPTPIRARRNPKWPKEWEGDWEMHAASASAMLRVQNVPNMFPNAKIMGEIYQQVMEESSRSSMKLSVNFDFEEPPSNSMKPQQMGSCLACGNCLTGCPYNAKNSTDKNYLASAIQAGCTVKTECKVRYVVENPDYITKEERISKRWRRRWLVFFNEIDYITADFVIISAGVFGTADILYQSQMRGLKLSEHLGSGFSCNGNNVAFLAGSPAPLTAYGLNRKKISKTPFQDRPGPSISSSFTSSSGFTIQSAVLPTAHPYLAFKWIATYRWPAGFSFLHAIIDELKQKLGLKSGQAMILNAMGYDESDGKITMEKDTGKLRFTPPYDPLLAKKIKVFQKVTKKLGGTLFMSKYRSTAVHLLGGCNASSSDSSFGVCNSNGQVFDLKSPTSVHMGLYVCDASLIPSSVGINPCLTIATAAEHVSRHIVQDVLGFKSTKGVVFSDSDTRSKSDSGRKSKVVIKETMRGYVGGMPCIAYLKMKMNSHNLNEMNKFIGESHPCLRGEVGGYVVLKAVEKDKLYVIDGEVDLCRVDIRAPFTQFMHYRLLLAASSGSRYILEGKKIMNPYLFALYAWEESTTMHVTLEKVIERDSTEDTVVLKGSLSISLVELLKSLISLEGHGRGRFICLLFKTFLRTYFLQVPRGNCKAFTPSEIYQRPYPSSTLHEIKTEDEFIISCRQWKCRENSSMVEGEKTLNPVLLLNGHSTESYWLPTEPNDLIRTLLEEGHETWLLQPRLHHLNPSNNFTIEDIGKYDIPAAISKIHEFHGSFIKVHVVAHCAGGLAIHIALMGGHVPAAHVASLSCTNSSMYFKLTASSKFKMWLPLIPISMMILGKNKTLPMLETSKVNPRQRLLKCVARFIPRCERCSYGECEVFSGIFGNPFWHANISPELHYWLNKQSLPSIFMSAFPHLRRICNSGFIVDGNGRNSYLIHPERMAISTLYISGGRSLLVTPETSFLANKYMKLHQPGFMHRRVVVEGFGHSDLLIGEESCKKVFPHILSHIRLAEEGIIGGVNVGGRKNGEEALAWSCDFCEGGGNSGFGSWVIVCLFVSLVFLAMLISLF